MDVSIKKDACFWIIFTTLVANYSCHMTGESFLKQQAAAAHNLSCSNLKRIPAFIPKKNIICGHTSKFRCAQTFYECSLYLLA